MTFQSRTLSAILPQSENSFGLVRLVCAAAVIVSHAMVLATGDRTADPFLAWTGFKLGDHAVNIFFVLSGIVTAASLARDRSVARFLVSRALRIVPAVAAFALVFALILAPVLTAPPDGRSLAPRETWNFILRTIAFAPGTVGLTGVFTDTPLPGVVNESLWTVKYEIACYLALAAFAACAAVFPRLGRGAAIAGTSLVLAVYLATIPIAMPSDTLGHIRHFGLCYALGVAAFLAADRLPVSCAIWLATIAALLAAIGTPLQPAATIICTAYGAIWAASFRWGGLRAAANRTDLSFGLYVWGWPIGQILLDGLPGLGWPLLACLDLAAATLAAILSWRLVERPALALKPRSGRIGRVLHRGRPARRRAGHAPVGAPLEAGAVVRTRAGWRG